MSEPRGSGPISLGQIVSAAAIAFAIFIFVVQAQRLTTTVVLWQQLQGIQAEINAGHAETDRLEQRKLYVQTNAYIESVARHDMKMGRQGEVSVIAVPAPATLTATVISTPQN